MGDTIDDTIRNMSAPNGDLRDTMLLQHEDRLRELETGKPLFETIGTFDDIRDILWTLADDEEFRNIFRDEEYMYGYICMYLNTYISMHITQRAQHHQEILLLWKRRAYKNIARWIYYGVRLCITDTSRYIRENPFVRPEPAGGSAPPDDVIHDIQSITSLFVNVP